VAHGEKRATSILACDEHAFRRLIRILRLPGPPAAQWAAGDAPERNALIAAVEARMRPAETFAWSVPALVIAGQSFLLTIGLDRQATSHEKEVAAVAGMLMLIAGLHFMWKHKFNFDVYEAVIERQNERLGQYPVAMKRLPG
jgi:hypothetical protein